MELINENFEPIPNNEDAVDNYYFEYNVKEKDFFLKYSPSWQKLTTTGFELYIDGGETIVPSGTFILIASLEGDLDLIKVDEIVSRPFEALVITNDFEHDTWQIMPITVTNVKLMDFYMPFSKNALPIDIKTNRAILTSQIDLYTKMSNYSFTDIV